MSRWPRALLLVSIVLTARAAESSLVDVAEVARPPSRERVAWLVAQAAQQGWGAHLGGLRAAAFAAYEATNGQAQSWYYLYRWAGLLSRPESKAIPLWIEAIEQARVGHPNMPRSYKIKPGSLAGYCSPELQLFALSSPAFSEEFFTTVVPADNPMNLLAILQALYAADPAKFADYQNLAIAIAVVYDVPPPPNWPHGQVSASALPRALPKPEDAFNFWIKADRENKTLHKLKRLPADELKFVVDTGAQFAEMTWAQQNIRHGLADFAKVYDLVKYRKDRAQTNQFMWPRPGYPLSLILQDGGICVDQAYFASTAGKARGVPTLLFRGAGLDGRHAWFGYLDSAQKWQLDCGRYAEQKFVAGLAYDPQTWGNISDHELLFLSERFRVLPLYKLSKVHADFAEEYLRDHNAAAAVKAAREAVNRERRNLRGWEALLQAQAAAGADAKDAEGTLREAALVFRRYPDLEAAFGRQLAQSLRARGETTLADYEEKRLARKNQQADRPDLAFQQAADMLRRSMANDDVATQIRHYNSVLDNFGRGAGVDFYDKVVVPFVRHLREIGQTPAAIQSAQRAQRTLRVEKGSQLEAELNRLINELRKP